MKKIVLGLFILLSSFVLIFTGVNTKAVSIPAMIDGAQIRTTGNQGLKFSATIDSLEGVTEHGFFVALGEHTKNAIETAVESSATSVGGKKLKKIVVSGSELTFHGVVYNIPAKSYEQDITALAYAYDGSSYTFASASVTRNILEVAQAAVSDPGYETNVFIDRICNTSTFNLNGGSYVYGYKFIISGDGDAGVSIGGSGLTLNIASKSNYGKAFTGNYSRIYVNKDNATGYYRIIAKGDAPENYDYAIGVHGNCTDTASANRFLALYSDANYQDYYLKIDIPANHTSSCSIEVIADKNYEMLKGNKMYFAANTTLPTLAKDYYTFNGWCLNSNLSDSPVTQHSNQEEALTYYAKFTPINYTIDFDLQGGESSGNSSLDDIIYNVTSNTINLPLANTMSIVDGEFKGWYTNSTGTGDAITSVPQGSHGDMTIYACWTMNVHTAISINADDKAALEALEADLIVYPSAQAIDGSYYLQYNSVNLGGAYTSKEFEYGVGAFATINDALDYLSANNQKEKKVYIFAGTYDEAIELTKMGTMLYGPSYNKAIDSRASNEAIITNLTIISAPNSTIRGLKYTYDGNSSGNIKVNADNATISHCYVAPNATIATYGGNRQGCIADAKETSGLTIEYSYICAPGASQSYTTQFASFGTISNLIIRNCYITNTASTYSSEYSGMMIYNPKGTINIEDNEFHWPTDGYVMFIGQATNLCSSINIRNNLFTGSVTKNSATIRVSFGSSALVTNIIGNRFINFVPGTFNYTSDTGSIVNVYGNYFDSNSNYRVSATGSATFNFNNNCFEGGINASDKSKASSIGTKLASLNDFNTYKKGIVVDASLDGATNGDSYSFNGNSYTYGTNAFETISKAVNAAVEGQNIYVVAGQYNEAVTINKSSISLIGPNSNIVPNGADRENTEAVIKGVITLANDTNNVTINGFKFTDGAQIYAETASAPENMKLENTCFRFIYNYVDKENNTTSIIYFKNADKVYTNCLIIDSCYFKSNNAIFEPETGFYGMIFINNSNNTTIINSQFTNISKYAIAIYDTSSTSGARGNITVENNVFKNISISALWFDYHGRADANSKILIKNNLFENVDTDLVGNKAAINFEAANSYVYSSIRIENNIFKHVYYCLWTASKNIVFTNNVIFKYGNSTNTIVARGSTDKPINCESNLYINQYDNGGPIFTAVENANGFTFNANVSNVDTNNYASINDYNTATGKDFGIND